MDEDIVGSNMQVEKNLAWLGNGSDEVTAKSVASSNRSKQFADWSVIGSKESSSIKFVVAIDLGSEPSERLRNQMAINGVAKALSAEYSETFKLLAADFISVELGLVQSMARARKA